MKSLSHVQLFVTPWTVACQGPLSMGLSRQEYWSGLPFPYTEVLPNPGTEPGSPALQAEALPSETMRDENNNKFSGLIPPRWNSRFWTHSPGDFNVTAWHQTLDWWESLILKLILPLDATGKSRFTNTRVNIILDIKSLFQNAYGQKKVNVFHKYPLFWGDRDRYIYTVLYIKLITNKDLLWASHMSLVVKDPPANSGEVRDVVLIPGWRRIPGGGHGNPLQYSCLENPSDRGVHSGKE